MKVLIINGSPRLNGNTSVAIREMEAVFKASDIETETVQVGNQNIRGCIACGKCFENGKSCRIRFASESRAGYYPMSSCSES